VWLSSDDRLAGSSSPKVTRGMLILAGLEVWLGSETELMPLHRRPGRLLQYESDITSHEIDVRNAMRKPRRGDCELARSNL
jgi:hypothetical protein